MHPSQVKKSFLTLGMSKVWRKRRRRDRHREAETIIHRIRGRDAERRSRRFRHQRASDGGVRVRTLRGSSPNRAPTIEARYWHAQNSWLRRGSYDDLRLEYRARAVFEGMLDAMQDGGRSRLGQIADWVANGGQS